MEILVEAWLKRDNTIQLLYYIENESLNGGHHENGRIVATSTVSNCSFW